MIEPVKRGVERQLGRLQRRMRPAGASRPPTNIRGFSLRGEDGKEPATKLGRLAVGAVSVEELNDPRFGRDADGTPVVIVDHATFTALSGPNDS